MSKKVKGYTFAFTLFFMLYLFLTSFNPKKLPNDSYNESLKNIITQWYSLYLKLESKDESAYPPVSAARLALLGVKGRIAYDFLHKEILSNNIQTLTILNNVYADALNQIYLNNKTDISEIIKLHQSIDSTIHEPLLYAQSNSNIDISLLGKQLESASEKFTCDIQHLPAEKKYFPILQPYQFNSTDPILPDWGERSTWVINKSEVTIPPPLQTKRNFNSALRNEALSVYTYSLNLSKEDKWIAEFWGDDVRGLTFSPAGRWISIANQLIHDQKLETKDIFDLYMKLGVGLNDASIICWGNKYKYNLQRPSSYINKHIDSSWKPFHDNPEFPSYPSGHAVLGATAVSIMESFFGTDLKFTDKSHHTRPEFLGEKRTFQSLRQMAEENALSRVILGVHYPEDCKVGLSLGFKIGQIINQLNPEYIKNGLKEPSSIENDRISL